MFVVLVTAARATISTPRTPTGATAPSVPVPKESRRNTDMPDALKGIRCRATLRRYRTPNDKAPFEEVITTGTEKECRQKMADYLRACDVPPEYELLRVRTLHAIHHFKYHHREELLRCILVWDISSADLDSFSVNLPKPLLTTT